MELICKNVFINQSNKMISFALYRHDIFGFSVVVKTGNFTGQWDFRDFYGCALKEKELKQKYLTSDFELLSSEWVSMDK